jgi:hypothetical protein
VERRDPRRRLAAAAGSVNGTFRTPTPRSALRDSSRTATGLTARKIQARELECDLLMPSGSVSASETVSAYGGRKTIQSASAVFAGFHVVLRGM